jgi:hypothetical protein
LLNTSVSAGAGFQTLFIVGLPAQMCFLGLSLAASLAEQAETHRVATGTPNHDF